MLTGDVEVGGSSRAPSPARSVGSSDEGPQGLRRPSAAPTCSMPARAAGLPTTAVGKGGDLFSGRGIARNLRPRATRPARPLVSSSARSQTPGAASCSPTSSTSTRSTVTATPHRGMRRRSGTSTQRSRLLEALRPGDVLMVTADHATTRRPLDRTIPGARPHPRRRGPVPAGLDLGRRQTFATCRDHRRLLASNRPRWGTTFL